MSNDYSGLTALSPLDGRYRSQLLTTADIFSEFGLISVRVKVEVAYLLFLADQGLIPKVSQSHAAKLKKIVTDFTPAEAQKIKDIEKTTKHDVKAVEYYLTDQLKKLKSPLTSYVHLCLTSEDTNSLAYSLMLKTAQQNLLVPAVKQILAKLVEFASATATLPMLARTHGQPAVPTTLGKEFMNVAMRLYQELLELENIKIETKLNGAVGNFNAHSVTFPDFNWLKLSDEFCTSLGLQNQLFTTQILPPESYSRMFASLLRINVILLDFNQDMWRYISDGYFSQLKSVGQVGSSTMPHKVNPIDFENSEGNLGLANALLQHFITKLPISRLQRDLSDSTVKRSIGTAFGYAMLAFASLQKGLGKVVVNEDRILADVAGHWEILAEPFQVILRFNGDVEGYQKLQKLTQGKHVTEADVKNWLESLSVSPQIKKQLAALTPTKYIGVAPELTERGLKLITRYLQGTS